MKILEQLTIAIVPLDNDGFIVSAMAEFPQTEGKEFPNPALIIMQPSPPKQTLQFRRYAKDVEDVSKAVAEILKEAITKTNSMAGK